MSYFTELGRRVYYRRSLQSVRTTTQHVNTTVVQPCASDFTPSELYPEVTDEITLQPHVSLTEIEDLLEVDVDVLTQWQAQTGRTRTAVRRMAPRGKVGPRQAQQTLAFACRAEPKAKLPRQEETPHAKQSQRVSTPVTPRTGSRPLNRKQRRVLAKRQKQAALHSKPKASASQPYHAVRPEVVDWCLVGDDGIIEQR